MKKIILCIILFSFGFLQAQSISTNEYLKYRVHYGFLNAGFATLQMSEEILDGRPQFHVVGKGATSGAVRIFYKLDDRYETYIDKETFLPSKFIRDIDEGGYVRNEELYFNHKNKSIVEKDLKHRKITKYRYKASNVQDLLSAFYYLRKFQPSDFKVGTSKIINIFMTGEMFPFQLKVLDKETVNTKFGKIDCIKMRPYVQKGRVFKEEEGVTVWVSDDDNLLPIQLQAELSVGTLKMSLYDYENIKTDLDFK